FYWHWRYTADHAFLEQRAYPYLFDCAVFLEAVTNERDADGKRTLPLSSSPEFNDNKPDAWFPSITNNDAALIRWLFGAAARMADELGKTDDAQRWRKALSEMPELSVAENGALMVAKDYPYPASHRHFSHLMGIFPLGIVDVSNGETDQRIIRASLEELARFGSDWWVGFSFAWHACLAARAKDGATAEKALDTFAEAFVLRNGFNANGDQTGKGYSKFTYRPFTLEANFAAAAGLQEMLLQSHTGVVEVFPAIPPSWIDVTFHNLRAEGAFLISAERTGGEITSVKATAERDGTLRIRAPKTGGVKEIALRAGQSVDVVP
ncbi:MAG: glycoside hydrolase family 95-like protein, partial [Candidatus Hydrogenedentales bacterium]